MRVMVVGGERKVGEGRREGRGSGLCRVERQERHYHRKRSKNRRKRQMFQCDLNFVYRSCLE